MPRLKNPSPVRPFIFLKKFLPKSLFGRSLIILLTPLILVQVILSYVFLERHTNTVLDLLAESIVGDMTMVMELVDQNIPMDHIKESADRHFRFKVNLTPEGTLPRLGSYRDKWLYQFMSEHLNRHFQYTYFLKITDQQIQVDIPHKRGLVTIVTTRKRLYSRTTPYVIIWTALSAFLLFAVASLFMRNQIRPIKRLADAAEDFGKGRQADDFRPEGATEVRKAGQAFLRMRNRLQRHMTERTEMLAGVSHDLRTPLARMKLQLAMMGPSEEVTMLHEDVLQMQKMLQGFLDFARGIGQEEAEEILLANFLQTIRNDHRHQHLIITILCPPTLKWYLKPELFRRCLNNIIHNANRYAKHLWIMVNVQENPAKTYKTNPFLGKHYLQIILDDDGPGIPPEEWENVFRPFYRLDKSRNLDEGNVGLGMNIARDVVGSHGGEILLGTSPQKGLRITIHIPL